MPKTIFFCLFHDAREESKLEDIAPKELHSKIQDPIFIEEAQLIDVREPEEVYVLLLSLLVFIRIYMHKKNFSLFIMK